LEEEQQYPLRIFLCHANEDKERVRGLYHRFKKTEGIEPWLDEENLLPGQHWRHEIPKVIQESHIVIVCLSQTSISKSGYLNKEIAFALDRADEQPEGTIFIIPARLEECEVPERLSHLHWVNLFERSGYEKLIGAIRERSEQLERKPVPPGFVGARISWLLVLLVTLALLSGVGGFFLWQAWQEQRTVYLMIDASENMQGLLEEMAPRIQLTTMSIPDRFSLGMAVFGGGLSGQTGCNDTTQLVPPALKSESAAQIDQAIHSLVELPPIGEGSLQNAALYALEQLQGRKGVQQIFLITSGIDSRCDDLDRDELNAFAAQKDIEYELVVITIGDVSDTEQQILERFSYGRYINAGTSGELPDVFEKVITTPPSSYDTYQY
jgi:hypothetical protein